MSVGGRLIEIAPHILRDEDDPAYSRDVIRLWCVDRDGTEVAVYCEPTPDLPTLGENIWWQGGKIMFDRDRKALKKVGFSFDPRAKP